MKKLILAIFVSLSVGCADKIKDFELGKDALANGDYHTAFSHFDKSCDGGYIEACASLAGFYISGKVVKKDFNKGFKMLQELCDKDSHTACGSLGMIYLDGNMVSQDKLKAKALLQKSCDLQGYFGCIFLGLMYYHGDSVDKDVSKAVRLIDTGCNNNDKSACEAAGAWYMDLGMLHRAKKLFEKGCHLGMEYSCERYRSLSNLRE